MSRYLFLTAGLLVLPGCYPHDVILEAPRAGPELAVNIPKVAVNPWDIPAWVEIAGAIAGLVAAGVGGRAAANKIRKRFGKQV